MKNNLANLKIELTDFFSNEKRVSKVWLFGSYAKGKQNINSDIDLMLKFDNNEYITLMDMSEIKLKLEKLLQSSVDIVEEGFVKEFAKKNIENEKIIIYEK